MIAHYFVGAREAVSGEVGLCTCGWESFPRLREGGAVDAVFRHRDRQEMFDRVGRPAARPGRAFVEYAAVAA